MPRQPGRVARIALAAVVAVATTLPAGLARAGDDRASIVWSPDRPLRWSDFRGSPPLVGGLNALSSWTVEVSGLRCAADGSFHARTRAVFLPDRSWVRGHLSEALLAHEQAHFDLAEVYARRLRERLRKELSPACRSGGAATALQRVYDDVLDAAERESARYDADTDHGRRPEEQRQWQRLISAELERESSARFNSPE